MIAKIITLVSSVALSASMAVSAVFSSPLSQAAAQPPVTQTAPQPPQSPGGQPLGQRMRDRVRARLLGLRADRLVRENLLLSTVSVTGLSPVEVLQGLKDGKSLAEIAQGAGKTDADILAVYNDTLEYVLSQRADTRNLSAEILQLRQDWFEEAGKLEVGQAGMVPAYPDLNRFRDVAFAAALKVTGLNRAELRQALVPGTSLGDVLVANGHTSQEALEAAMQNIGQWLDKLVQDGKLTLDQRQAWSDSINGLLGQVLSTPVPTPPASGNTP